jgi:hypothetical protein
MYMISDLVIISSTFIALLDVKSIVKTIKIYKNKFLKSGVVVKSNCNPQFNVLPKKLALIAINNKNTSSYAS